MDETPCMEFCAATVQHLQGKRLRRRILTPGEDARCEICGEALPTCGCRGQTGLFEPDTGSWVCDKCLGIFKDFLTLETE